MATLDRAANDSGGLVSTSMESTDRRTAVEESQLAETALVVRAQSGDVQAYADLVRRYQRRVVSVAYRLLGNSEDASDVGQDALVRAYGSLKQLNDASRFGAWLLRITTNLSLNFRRARAARATVSMEDAFDGSSGTWRPEPSAGGRNGGVSEPLSREVHLAVTEAMEQLPDKQRLALVLFSVEGLPQKEVADILECSVELVKWNVFQARKKLKESLKEYL